MRKGTLFLLLLCVSPLFCADVQQDRENANRLYSMIREELVNSKQKQRDLENQLMIADREIELSSNQRERDSAEHLKQVEELQTHLTEYYTCLTNTNELLSEYSTLLDEKEAELARKNEKIKKQRKWLAIGWGCLIAFIVLFIGWRVATKILKYKGIDLPEWLDELL